MEKNKYILPSFAFILFTIILIVFIGTKNNPDSNSSNLLDNSPSSNVVANNVFQENGKQIIKIRVDGGYSPSTTIAKAGIPTTIEFDGGSGYDCSHGVNIPSIGYSGRVPSNGSVSADLGKPLSGSNISGICSMGMYRFNVKFN